MTSSKKKAEPPRSGLGEWILRRILKSDEAESISGDYQVLYFDRVRRHGRFRARIWYGGQILRAAWNAAVISLYWNSVMFRNNFKVAVRHLKKDRAYSTINIFGLGIGMACCMMILLWVQDELGFDRFHENAAQLHRVLYQSGEERYSSTCSPLAAAVESELSEVSMATRYRPIGKRLIRYADTSIRCERFCLTDPRFFQMFTFPFIQGDVSNALSSPSDVVLTRKMADRIFGDEDPLGKTIQVEGRFDFQVTGILENIPRNSHIQFDVLARFEFLKSLWGEDLSSWGSNSHITYVRLRPGSDPEAVGERIDAVYQKNVPQAKGTLNLFPLTGIHLASIGMWVDEPSGSRTHVLIFSIIAGFILLIACINFINLTTARSMKRAREVGVRKTIGARRQDLIRQFFGESLLSAGLAFLLAVLLVPVLLPFLNNLAGKQMTAALMGDLPFIGGMIVIALATGLFSGSYPALFLASFKPVTALRALPGTGVTSRTTLRKGLVVLQFAISVFLIIGTFIISAQLRFIQRQDLGFNREGILTMPVTMAFLQQISPAGAEILQNPHIASLTLSNTLPGQRESTTSQIGWDGKDPDQTVRMELFWADLQFLETFGMEMAEGRFFSRSHVSELRNGIVINQTAAKAMGFIDESPLGKRMTNTPSGFSSQGQDATIIGVVKDFHTRSLHFPIEPLVIKYASYPQDNLSIRIRAGAIPEALDFLRGVWERTAPDFGFEFRFFDEVLDGLYRSEVRMGRLFRIFGGLAVLISCLGLFGLAAYSAQLKTKEIGIRKIFGASESNVILGQSRDFILLVLVSLLAAFPAAYLVGRKWLEGFAYRMRLDLWIFLVAGLLAMGIAFLTVSLQIWRAARADPVDCLRYE